MTKPNITNDATDKPKEGIEKAEQPSAAQIKSAAAKAMKQANLAKAKQDKPQQTSENTAMKTENNVKKTAKSETKTLEHEAKPSVSKLAILACIIALLALGGSGYLYWLQQQQKNEQQQFLTQLNQQTNALTQQITEQSQQQLAQYSTEQKNTLAQWQAQLTEQNERRYADIIKQLNAVTSHDPSEWLISEANYLVRIAARSLWLEKNPTTAIALLKEANLRLKRTQNPEFISVRQAINNDIEQLALLPSIDNEQTIISIQALANQVEKLPLAQAYITQPIQNKADNELSNDIADWRQNLAKVWRSFVEEFITVRRRTGNVEPLLAPQLQQNLRANIQLKLQLAQWAIAQQKQRVFQQTLTEVSQWVTRYFDNNALAVAAFVSRINELSSMAIAVKLPESLASVSAMQQMLLPKETNPQLVPESTPAKENIPQNANQEGVNL